MGAEGWSYFRTAIPATTLAWRLWLNGAGNSIYVADTHVPLSNFRGGYDLRQPSQMLLVPDYLVSGKQ